VIYSYEKETNIKNLTREILNSAITIALDYINLTNQNLDIYFKASLSNEEKDLLDNIVDAHDSSIVLAGDPQEVIVVQTDSDTAGIATSPRWAPQGWHQVYHEIEFQTSKLNSIHDHNWQDQDTGYSSTKFYDAQGQELTTQETIDTDCVESHYDFMPTFSIGIKSGKIAQIVTPNVPVYLWAIGAPGILDICFCNGGINLEFVGSKELVGLDGTGATILPYSHPQLGDGMGTNKIRFIVRHPAGFKHRIQAIFEYYRE